MKLEHLGRYLFASAYLGERESHTVADIACGVGYGLPELSKVCRRVIGIDGDPQALEIAAANHAAPGVRLVRGRLGVDDLSNVLEEELDAIVSFETLEHHVDPGAALEQFSTLLAAGGYLLCSVPNVLYESRDRIGLPKNAYHKRFFTYSSLAKMLNQYGFEIKYRLGQPLTNALLKKETELLRRKIIESRPSRETPLHSPAMIRKLSHLLAYPTVEDAEGSYSIIVVARRIGGSGVSHL